MSTEKLSKADMLSTLPCETLINILSHLSLIGDGIALASACKTLREKLIVQLYKEAGRQFDWLPLLFGASEGNTDTLERCLQAGAPLDHRWLYIGDRKSETDPGSPFMFCRAIDWINWSGKKEAQEWFTKNTATDTQERPPKVDHDSSVKTPEAPWVVFDVRTFEAPSFVFDLRTSEAEETWRPVLYQPEVYRPVFEDESHRWSAHPVWYGSKIDPCLISRPLLDILKNYPAFGVRNHLQAWTSLFWLDMIHSSKDPASLFQSGFFQEVPSGRWRQDIYGKISFIDNMTRDLIGQEFGRHFSPSIFPLLLDSKADVCLIASAYVSIFNTLFWPGGPVVDYIATLKFYPLILQALLKSVAGTDPRRAENFRDRVLDELHFFPRLIFEYAVTKVLDNMADYGASHEEMLFAFSPLARRLLQDAPNSLSGRPHLRDLLARSLS